MINPSISARKREPAAHGGGVRGDNSVPRSSEFEGRFGRMFRSLPSAEWPKEALLKLGDAMTSPPEQLDTKPPVPTAALEDSTKRIQDDEENAGISAGYTYLGQFIDHDITFDPASSLEQQNDPDALVDFRTPRLDLDSLYGRGPGDQPYMYVGNKFRLGRPLFENTTPSPARDLPRFNDPINGGAKRALIGDKRNDENVIVAQLHAAMLQFHNKLVDRHSDDSFERIQQRVRWHYQWIAVNDFLKTICGEDVVQDVLPDFGMNKPTWKLKPNLSIFRWRNDPFMPIEFSAAAYRFGHSMVRPIYRLNAKLNGGDDPNKATQQEQDRGLAGRFFIFAGVQKRGLNGFDEFPEQWAIDWSLFFDTNGSINKVGKERVQPAYKIDSSVVNPLGFLPEFSKPPQPLVRPFTVEQLQSKPLDLKGRPSVRGRICLDFTPSSWDALFEARQHEDIDRIQFALAGMNAHINHDLSLALLQTDNELRVIPTLDGPEHSDFERVNDLLQAVLPSALQTLATGILGEIAQDTGKIGQFLAFWNVRVARDFAWEFADHLRSLNGLTREFAIVAQDKVTGALGRSLLISS
jgi:Family of unknown function (DUF5995)/Animal haem peroxidase